MKKISNWSLLGYAAGGIFAVGTFVKYYIMTPDLSQDILGVSIGLIIIGLSFLYNRQVEQGNDIKAIEDYLDDKNFEEKHKGDAPLIRMKISDEEAQAIANEGF